jgi:transcriptional regulator with XRE-family HTH domain
MSAKLDSTDTELKEKIALRIKELRLSTGKKQNDFATNNLETDKQMLQRLESGRGATIYSVNRMCLALNITLKDFFDSPLFEK